MKRFVLAFALLALLVPGTALAEKYKVLVVMSYEENNPWVQEIKSGIESALGDAAEARYVYMDTKVNIDGGPEKAKEAWTVYQDYKPDGVITADDNAQSMFVLPYLKDKVKTPVMFCGVNADAEKYGFPATNVSGVLERAHVRESIAFVQQLVPTIKSVGFLVKDSPSGKALIKQVEMEKQSYPAKIGSFHPVKTTAEIKTMGPEMKKTCDAMFVDSLEGLPDDAGAPLKNKDVLKILFEAYGHNVIGANRYHVREGALSAVVKTGEEQGRTAGAMLLKAMRGTPVSEIPVTKNFKGRRVINVTTMERLGITPRPIDLRGAELVRTDP